MPAEPTDPAQTNPLRPPQGADMAGDAPDTQTDPLRPPTGTVPAARPDGELHAEGAHLAASRDALRRMRTRALSLDAAGGNAFSTEYLEAALHRRALDLVDDPSTPLFFGRLDTAPRDGEPRERFYIGRRHVHDEAGDPMVIDWRADVARPFYRASRSDPMGVELRRRFGFSAGSLTAYEDEHLLDPVERERSSRILTEEIERPRVGPMRDIVATIQPEQDEIVRAPLDESVCVQGAPGTGKTAVGLHRAAYLLYAFRRRLRRGGVLVVGPNRAFLAYIAQVLPALGEVDVRQMTVEDLVAHVRVGRRDPAEVAMLKGDARMAEVLRRAVWSHLRLPTDSVVVTRGSRRYRVSPSEVGDMVANLRGRDVPYAVGRSMLARLIASAVIQRVETAGGSVDERTMRSLVSSRAVRAVVDEVWPAVDPVRLVRRLLGEPNALAVAADGLLDQDEQRAIGWRPRSRGWSAADAVLVDETVDLVDRVPSVGHVVLDEAQDLSPMQYRAVGRRCRTGSLTVLGDLAQGTSPWAAESWGRPLAHLGKPAARVEVLRRGYRVPHQVITYASRLLPMIGVGLEPPIPVREAAGTLHVRRAGHRRLGAETIAACRDALGHEGSVGVIVAEARLGWLERLLAADGVSYDTVGDDGFGERLTLVPAALAKGLEFDHVVVVEPAAIVAGEAHGLRRLYVALTRAVSRLTVVHADDLPGPLATAEAA